MLQSRWTMVVLGLLVAAMAIFPMLDALEFFPGSVSRMNAPPWVVFLAGSLFFIVGMWVFLLGVVGGASANTIGGGVGLIIFLGLAAIFNWIAFGGGDRNDCSGGISAFGIGLERAVAEMECRAGFGWCALLLDFLLLRGIAWWIVQRAPKNRAARVFEKVAEWGIGLLLLPIVLLVMALTAIRKGREKLAGKQQPKA